MAKVQCLFPNHLVKYCRKLPGYAEDYIKGEDLAKWFGYADFDLFQTEWMPYLNGDKNFEDLTLNESLLPPGYTGRCTPQAFQTLKMYLLTCDLPKDISRNDVLFKSIDKGFSLLR